MDARDSVPQSSKEVEKDKWNEKRIKVGVVDDLSSNGSLALAVYSINED